MHKFDYRWTLADAHFTKDKGTVFSCFACGGGSSMGYKLAGFDVIGCNEIDHRMMFTYCKNHNPRFPFLEPIQTFKDKCTVNLSQCLASTLTSTIQRTSSFWLGTTTPHLTINSCADFSCRTTTSSLVHGFGQIQWT